MAQVRRVSPDQIIDLRHIVLRDGLPRSEAIFPGDDSAHARHYGAFESDLLVGCVTLHLNEWEKLPAWQLRGMAVAADARTTGIGRAMIEMLERDLDDSSIRQLWCNARVPASGFYVKLGWQIVSQQFEIPTAGPHVRMTRRLGPIPAH
jgi:N-acetylglutamate synthase-like GNAT family acetyltransferase